jgi:hypothetical protein
MNLVFVTDPHGGSKYSLCPEDIRLDEDRPVALSCFQKKLWEYWEKFKEWVWQEAGNDYTFVCGGDTVQGNLRMSIDHIMSPLIEDQKLIAIETLRPLREKAEKFYMVRGTEAHVKGNIDGAVARALKANKFKGESAAWRLPLKCKNTGAMIEVRHHSRVTGLKTNLGSLLAREWEIRHTEAFRKGEPQPHMLLSGHNHTYCKAELNTHLTESVAVTSPSWQLMAGYTYKAFVSRNSYSEFGGVILQDENGEVKVKNDVR